MKRKRVVDFCGILAGRFRTVSSLTGEAKQGLMTDCQRLLFLYVFTVAMTTTRQPDEISYVYSDRGLKCVFEISLSS